MLNAIIALAVAQADGLQTVTLTVDGVERQFIAYAPLTKDARPRPLVFAFHGHGGNMRYSLNRFKFNKTWPQAVSLYPQGLPTKGMTDPDGKKNGWQQRVNTEGNRDEKFLDAMLEWAKKNNRIDEKNVFSMGHSNGGAMTMVAWNSHPNLFKGLGVCCGGGRTLPENKPTALFSVSGRNDPIVKFAGQQLSFNSAKRVNGATGEGKPYGNNSTIWEGKAPSVWYVSDGGHELPEEALEQLTKFFKDLSKKP
jgi:polyhydroxybutyrate depolymerase